ncbi:MAG: ketol-acid reductoisomerase [Kiritimatiellaeota bacterium]|nr:ketol-acid reductoisomerase [Kiritimatiellota bacterium]
MQILHDHDADLGILDGKVVAVIGYGSQGSAQAQCLRDSGVNVIIGSIKDASYDKAVEDGFEVLPISEAAKRGDVVHILLPDEFHGPVYAADIKDNLEAGNALCCSHGFNLVYKQIVPPEDVDVIMVAPKSPATEERKAYLEGFGVPGLIAVRQDATGQARDIALALAKAMGFTRAGCLECTFEEETYEDLFGEQTVLCGGCVELLKAGFEVLTEAGYPPEMAYFECLHELKLIVDLIYEGGIQKMNAVISNTAEWGEYTVGPKIIDAGVKQRMKEALAAIEDGSFAREWIEESRQGAPNLLRIREELGNHPIEVVGRRIREMFERRMEG